MSQEISPKDSELDLKITFLFKYGVTPHVATGYVTRRVVQVETSMLSTFHPDST